jgi:LmbE family N-acetylglucosaminyl deacetylase
MDRRSFTKKTMVAATAFSLSSLTVTGMVKNEDKLKIVCIGGHPDDPESGCGGTLAKFSNKGYSVSIIYLTSGEAGIEGVSHKEAAKIRTKEAKAACAIINAKPIFAGQIDGATIVNNEWVEKLHRLLLIEKPDVVFTHWPIDSHKDHQVASLLSIQSWVRMEKTFALYFFEVCTGSQTTGFTPTDYVDITSTQKQKRKAVYCHTSQNPEGIYKANDCNHALMEKFRGVEMNVAVAEAFVKMNGTINME